ncbi:hypothetical protein Tco_1051772 [Tanacetum coccineum]
MENANPSSPPESPNSFRNRKIHEITILLEFLNATAPPLKRDSSYLEGDVGFVELFKEYEIGYFSEEEIEEEVVEVEELGVEYFDKYPTRDELAYHKVDPEDIRRISNFTGRTRGMPIFVGNFTYIADFLIVEDISPLIDPCLSQVVLRKPFVEIEQFRSLSTVEKEYKQSVYFRNDEEKRRGVDYVMKKIFGFYKECPEL